MVVGLRFFQHSDEFSYQFAQMLPLKHRIMIPADWNHPKIGAKGAPAKIVMAFLRTEEHDWRMQQLITRLRNPCIPHLPE